MQYTEQSLSAQNGRNGKVTVAFDNNLAILHMECGENRFNHSFVQKLNDALNQIEKNQSVHALITTGDGKFFSNGFDIHWMATMKSKDELNYFINETSALLWRFITFPMPTIAAVNGHAYALGAFLSLCHDYIMMNSEKGWWCFNEIHNGYLFPDFFKAILRARLNSGPVYHKAVVMGHRFTGEEAVTEGVAIETVPTQGLLPRATQLANKLVEKGPYNRGSLRNMKSDVYISIKKEIGIQKSKSKL